jgi:hypothetical protein
LIYALVILAHSFIPSYCCGNGDCFETPAISVREVGASYEFTTEHGVFMVPMSNALTSPDQEFYICLNFNYQPAQVRPGCVWAPRGMS